MKVLFFGLEYHNYTRALIAEMELQGAEVTFVDIQPRSVFFKLFRTLARGRYDAFLRRHHAGAFRAAMAVRYDRVVFVQVHQVALTLLAEMRENQSGVPFVLYNWDSLSTHDYLSNVPYFDEVFTFDGVDAAEHGFRYLPLFATREMQALRRDMVSPRSVYVVGNIVNPKRYEAIRAFKAYCDANGIAFEAFMKITPVVYMRMLRAGTVPRGISFRSIAPEVFDRMIERSGAVFDFANHQQSGHTMRTIENLVCGKKIITNNTSVRHESFFSEDRITVYEGLDFSGVSTFLDIPIVVSEDRFAEYGIQAFTRRLLLLDQQGTTV
ncbi:MAG: hypothetical protein B7Y02_00165 [Rhodobacterales bacterium 17-64-5]|nr:MAG: hypothetical protein B7Y02_00165 [Rhodobacterales bacterium 17-64-5]